MTPAPGADPAGHNTGVGGTRHGVADSEPPEYGQTAGVVYEAPGFAEHPGSPDPASFTGPAVYQTSPDTEITDLDALLDTGDVAGPAPDEQQPPVPQPAVMQFNPPLGPIRQAIGSSAGETPRQPRRRAMDLAVDARMRFWRSRLLIMAVVFIIFTIIGNWTIGLTLAIIAGIADTVARSRMAASLPPGTRLDPAQRRTQRQLAGLERRGYYSLHRRPLPNSDQLLDHKDQFIDHLVIGPTGVYAIDSEKWNKSLPIRTRNGKQLWHGPESKKSRLEHAHWEAEQAGQLLSARLGQEIVVRPAMAVYGPAIPWDIAVIRDVDVFSGNRLGNYLRKRSKVREVPKLSKADVDRIHRAAEAVLPIAGPGAEVAPVG